MLYYEPILAILNMDIGVSVCVKLKKGVHTPHTALQKQCFPFTYCSSCVCPGDVRLCPATQLGQVLHVHLYIYHSCCYYPPPLPPSLPSPPLPSPLLPSLAATERKLSMIFGVTIPCCLSIFCVILFLRIGFVLGQVSALRTKARTLSHDDLYLFCCRLGYGRPF